MLGSCPQKLWARYANFDNPDILTNIEYMQLYLANKDLNQNSVRIRYKFL